MNSKVMEYRFLAILLSSTFAVIAGYQIGGESRDYDSYWNFFDSVIQTRTF